jgi:hypothetical protein
VKEMNKEESAIRQTLRNFFEGVDNLDAALIKEALYPEERSFYISDTGTVGGLRYGDWDDYLVSVKQDFEHPLRREKSKKEIVYIDITGTAAAAKANLIFSDFTFVDYYNLLKVDGRWYIVNTTFHTIGFDPIG